MREAALLLVLVALVSACDSGPSARADTPTTPAARGCFFEVVTTKPVDTWPSNGEDCVSGLIEEEMKGREAVVDCGSVSGGRASCRANWTDSDYAYCTGTFKLQVNGPYVKIADDIPVICSKV